MENSCPPIELMIGQDILSLEASDSNALILPAKRSKKRREKDQELQRVKEKQNPKLSKSQIRKLKKIEEEKEKSLLLSTSIETLEKYKIPEDIYSLLQSSKTIGQAKTIREKRRTAILFSKAGLEVPHSVKSSKGWDHGNNSSSSSEPETELEQLNLRKDTSQNHIERSMVIEKEVAKQAHDSLSSSQKLTFCKGLSPSCSDVDTLPTMEVSFKNGDAAFEEGMETCIPKLPVDDGRKSTMSKGPLSAPTVVHVRRPDEIENKRKELPIVMMEQEIMEAINENSTVIICGETGCGKTTQVPQFLYEAGFGSSQSTIRSGVIGVTQPRRVAVLATAKRVAFELGLHLGKEVGFQVRHDKKIGDKCSIKFMTDGILLREVQNDALLKRYSVLVLDEAHERSLNTDILIGMLSRVIRLRQDLYEKQQQMVLSGQSISPENMIFPLNLVLMSATLRMEDFISGRRLFRIPPPVIEVPTRQYPVTIHFSKRTELVDYIGQAFKKVMSIHKRLPPGAILVFVTGQREVEYLCRRLRKASKDLMTKISKGGNGTEATPYSQIKLDEGINMKDISEAFEINGDSTHQKTDRFSSYDEDHYDYDEDDSDASYDSETDSELEIFDEDGKTLDQKSMGDGDNLVDVLGGDGSLASLKAAFEALSGKDGLNSNPKGLEALSINPENTLEQPSAPIEKISEGNKGLNTGSLRVLPLYAMLPATAQLRVFEEYVVDTGREKVKNYNPTNGMEMYEVQWISKASAAQRAGRAGRTGPGHCYRLYSSAVFSNILPDFSCAEISKIPVDGVVLLMKSMGIDKVANFPFPTSPGPTALVEAERCLKALEALDSNGKLTSLGKAMAYYPMSPRHSRMLLTVIQIMKMLKNYARENLVLGYAVAAAAVLSSTNPFVIQYEERHSQNDESKPADGSNPLDIAYALQCFELSENQVNFCNENALHLKTMEEMSKLRKQLLQLVFNQNVRFDAGQDFLWTHGTMNDVEHSWSVSSSKNPLLLNEEELLGQAICAGWADRVAKRIRGVSRSSEGDRKVNTVRYQACLVKETVFLHRSSFLSSSAPEFLVYSGLIHTKRPYMHGATSVKSDWLVKYAKSHCTCSAPLTDPKPYYDPQTDEVYSWVVPTFGPHLWQLPMHNLQISNNEHRATVFAFALLEGKVLPCLSSVKQFMSASPDIILKPESYGQSRVGNLLHKFKTWSIDSCGQLRNTWEENLRALHSEILDWFQESFYSQFEKLWSDMLSQVLLEPEERFPKRLKREKRKN
ncbi:putative ATP-dependent RNA helicase DHX37-like isoform X2 [Hibiscus syriacus]|uniref:RNA helicase n=1 Tax=Hibiscus syriacus TaxID=106335 RepID=A0A6A2XET3_HIBSY|nr:putative ATP-dependent RNA helicase DHX37-like isoform X2 [Hibiscus syriacus]